MRIPLAVAGGAGPRSAHAPSTDKCYISEPNAHDVTTKQVRLTSRDKQLIEHLANNFPVVSRPFEVVAEHFDMDETTLLEWVTELVAAGQLKSFKPTLDLEVKEE